MNSCALYNVQAWRRKKRVLLAISIMLILISLLLSFSFSMAKDCTCGTPEAKHEKGEDYPCTEGWNSINKFVFDMQKLINGANPLSYADTFTIDFSSGAFGRMWSSITVFYNSIKVIGCMLVVVYFLLEIIEASTRESFTIEHLIKTTIKLFIALLVIQNGLEILKLAVEFGNGLVDKIAPSDPEATGAPDILLAYYNEYKEAAWYETIGSMAQMLIPYLGFLISYIIILLMVYSRYIDIAVRAIFAPIGMANIYEGGLNSSGMKYLKKFLAAALQGAIMAGIAVASSMITAAISVDSLAYALGMSGIQHLLVILCTAMAMIKSKSWANDLMGVQ